MDVVARGLMVAGLFVYAGIHLLQGIVPPDSAPAWLRLAFVLSALAAVGLGVALVALPPRRSGRWMDLAALLALASGVALALSFTTGLAGVSESDLRLATLGVVIAELVILHAWLGNRLVGREFDEVEDPVPDLRTPGE
ncbi:hypothetical protein [Salsipaludibacter albus]|uniref:hypothetical protein n=1 Tax=Salsipaludibacter albus TaxID=2849650 RepID=UPI001EE46DD7|nr:hypothetical protein [Salsipaludibacter albus]MBY5161385.1 hypothetical protein [Salsipaludibacter albus]